MSCSGDFLLARLAASSAASCTLGLIVVLICRPPSLSVASLIFMSRSSRFTYLTILALGLLLPQVVVHLSESNLIHVLGYSVGGLIPGGTKAAAMPEGSPSSVMLPTV